MAGKKHGGRKSTAKKTKGEKVSNKDLKRATKRSAPSGRPNSGPGLRGIGDGGW